MRVLFVTWASPGHLFPMVPLAWACQAAGHQVRVAGPPSCRDAIDQAGLPTVVTGQDIDLRKAMPPGSLEPWRRVTRWPAGWPSRPESLDADQKSVIDALANKQVKVAEAMADDLVAFGRWWRPDVVVHDPLCFAGALVAAVLGVPAFAHGWEIAPIVRAEMRHFGDEPLPGYARLLDRFGAKPRTGTLDLIDITPPSMRVSGSVDVRRHSSRFVPYNGPGAMPRWLMEASPRPRVCVTSGMVLGRYRKDAATDVFDRAMKAFADLDVEVVIAAGAADGGNLAGLPPRTRVAESIPFHLLLPECQAVVHHGGAGTGLTAIASGVPQLVIAQSPMYAETGLRIAESGAGIMLDQLHDEAIHDALAALLSENAHRAALDGLRAEMARQNTPARLVNTLANAA